MRINYAITAHSIIEMSGQRIFDTYSHQQWEIEEVESDGKGRNILITVHQLPQTDTPEVEASFRLMELINQPLSRLHLSLNTEGQICEVINQEEIREKWAAVSKQLPDLIGDEEIIRNLISKTNESLQLLKKELWASLLHFVLLFPLRPQSPPVFITPSVLNQGDQINFRLQPLEQENGHCVVQGKGKLYNQSTLRKQYEKEIRPYAKVAFDYQSSFRMSYLPDETDGWIREATADIIEQASETYIYQNQVHFNRITEAG